MLEFTRSKILSLATHYVGNCGLGEKITLSSKPITFSDDVVKTIFFDYLFSGFKNDIYYKFKSKSDVYINDVKGACENIFNDPKTLFDLSKDIADNLYRQTMNPKVKGGELYVTYIQDAIIDGELCDAIGIFKSESKDTFIKVDLNVNTFAIETDLGINPKKLDKGVLIFNTDKNDGYKALIIDNSQKIPDAATYWSFDFLGMELKQCSFLNTKTYIDQAVAFCEEILTEENNVKKNDKNMILNNSVKYFDQHDLYNQSEFETQVLVQPELIEAFKAHQDKYVETYNKKKADNFTISETAVKKNAKLLKSVISLDNNYDINIKGGHESIENGFDEEKGMKFYKLYYVNEG